ncbi:hypothetical protein PTTG_06225 [Puccinia triticina 1-1 BBBD Race 1]|uniref:Acyl-CoA thioesterase II n=2 Tax=Puccinia triticina TaxID=208348 RepID=A0A180GR00_PUCT1|nr:uncharacterized protein PtA15_7A455 [Puccinia triticina]OAV94819.1 hypothetical protein PTTG_06225 [Puccinia triticina 1-1 BBBD Race 1]WAQ86727.1 hypothetical protein PtA15_7A455 [Puccinia triticina]WAR56590.1 hypothetical protein PtB15_7B439 [Puccinia triticina]
MAGSKETQRIEESLELQEIDKDIFKSIKLWKFTRGVGAFGGNIIAQAAHAATKTVQIGYHLHSLHCYFISFGDVDLPTGIIYLVDRIRDGKSYATRAVKAIQRSRCIFTLLISFHKPELNQKVLEPKIDLDPITPPEECQPVETRLQNYVNENKASFKPKMLEYLEREIEENRLNAIEHRNTRLKKFDQSSNPDTSESYWFRSRAKIRSDPAYQKLVLAYASDFRFIGTVSKAMGLNLPGGPRASMLASLDHSMFFYDHDFDVSDWMLYKMDAESGKDGRGLVIGRIYARDGRLLAVCTQEGVVRVEAEGTKVAPKL